MSKPHSQQGRWLIEFGLVGLALIGTVGLALGQTVSGNLRERAVANGLGAGRALFHTMAQRVISAGGRKKTLAAVMIMDSTASRRSTTRSGTTMAICC